MFTDDFKGANMTLVAASGHEQYIAPMRMFANGSVCVSCWRFSADDIRSLQRQFEAYGTAAVYVAVLSGSKTQPPIYVGLHDEVRRVVADFGKVWKL